MTEREQKALIIAAKSKLTRNGDKWLVPSQSSSKKYVVDPNPERPTCNCPDFELRQQRCKHIYAAELVIERESTTTRTRKGKSVTTTVKETVKVTYRQEWTAYNTAQTQEKALFQKLLADLCGNVSDPVQVMGRPRLSYGDMIFCGAFKVYSTMSSRRFATDLRDAHAKGFISKTPHFNSVLRYLDNAALTPVLKEMITRSALPLKAIETDFAIDSSGFSTCQYVKWLDVKYAKGGEKHAREVDHHDWIKMHIMTGVKTNVVTSVEITGRAGEGSADTKQLPPLVEDTTKRFNVKEVSADKAYSSFANHELIDFAGATPYIAFKANANPKAAGMFEKMFHYYSFNREAFLASYHKRSNVETTFHMVKSKFGAALRSKEATAQTNEALCKVLCHNLCCVIQSMFEFGIEPTF